MTLIDLLVISGKKLPINIRIREVLHDNLSNHLPLSEYVYQPLNMFCYEKKCIIWTLHMS